MANYREFISKRECLVNAVLWSVIPALQIGLLLFFPDTQRKHVLGVCSPASAPELELRCPLAALAGL